MSTLLVVGFRLRVRARAHKPKRFIRRAKAAHASARAPRRLRFRFRDGEVVAMESGRAMRIEEGGLDDTRVIDLLTIHVTRARAQTAKGSAHALDVSGLKHPSIRFWTIWDGATLLGTAALKRLDGTHGEIKSMHVAEAARRKGAGSAILRHALAEAKAMGLERASLETGAWDYFAPARALYARHGFVECGPFEGYKADPNSVFMTRALSARG
jgi:putative acetyltransferase